MTRSTIEEAIDFYLAWREQSTRTVCVCLQPDRLSLELGLPCSCTGASPFRRDARETAAPGAAATPPSEG
jgi:predicted transport protein